MNLDEEVSIPKYELIMVLKENEALRKKNSFHQNIIEKMNQKMGMVTDITSLENVKLLIGKSEKQHEAGLKQIERLRKEGGDLRKILSKNDLSVNYKSSKIIETLNNQLGDAFKEIVDLKKTISKFTAQNIDQWAKLGKEIISLQIKLDRQQISSVKKERELSFSRTIGMSQTIEI